LCMNTPPAHQMVKGEQTLKFVTKWKVKRNRKFCAHFE
jgi:hypothetical protein